VLGNLFFLQNILVNCFGTNGPIWSLANEFWYYILFPLALIAVWRHARWAHRLVCVALFVAIAWFVRSTILVVFPIWIAGAALFKVAPPRFTPRIGRCLRIGASLVYLAIFLALGRLHEVPNLFSDYVLAAITFFFLWVMLSAEERAVPEARSVRASRGEISRVRRGSSAPIAPACGDASTGDGQGGPGIHQRESC